MSTLLDELVRVGLVRPKVIVEKDGPRPPKAVKVQYLAAQVAALKGYSFSSQGESHFTHSVARLDLKKSRPRSMGR